MTRSFHVNDVMLSYAVEVCWCLRSYNFMIKITLYSPNFKYLVSWPLALITCLVRLGIDQYKFEMHTLEMEYQILLTARTWPPFERIVCCSCCNHILVNLQMFSGDWEVQSRQSTSLLYFHSFICTDWCTRGVVILDNPLIIFEFYNDW